MSFEKWLNNKRKKRDLKMSIKYLNYEDFLFLIFSQLNFLLERRQKRLLNSTDCKQNSLQL